MRTALLAGAAGAAALAAAAGCGGAPQQRQAAAAPVTAAPVSRVRDPLPEQVPVDQPRSGDAIPGLRVRVPVDDRPEGYWSVSSAHTAAEGLGQADSAAERSVETPSGQTGAPAATATAATAPAAASTAAQAPTASATAAAGATVLRQWVEAGTLVVPSRIEPGWIRLIDAKDRPIEHAWTGHDVWLIRLPLAWNADPAYGHALCRIAASLRIADPVPGRVIVPALARRSGAAIEAGWRMQHLHGLGDSGLRYGTDPGADAATYGFRTEALLSALGGRHAAPSAMWDQVFTPEKPFNGSITCHALLITPRGASVGRADLDLRLWFTTGAEATVTVPTQSIAIALHGAPPPPAPASATAAAPGAQAAAPATVATAAATTAPATPAAAATAAAPAKSATSPARP